MFELSTLITGGLLILTGIILIISYLRNIVLSKREKTIKALYDTTWAISNDYYFLIDKNGWIERTNFFQKNKLPEPSTRKRFGDIFECKNALKANGCTQADECKNCPMRLRINETLIYKKLFKNEEVDLEFFFNSVQAEHYYLTISSTPTNVKGKEYVLVSVHDITKEKELEGQVYNIDQKFSMVFDSLPSSCVICDKHGIIQEINRATIMHLGVNSKNDVIGKNIFNNPCIDEIYKEQMRKGISVKGEVKYDYNLLNQKYVQTTISDEIKYFQFIVNYIKKNGKTEAIVIIWVDNTLAHRTLKENKRFINLITQASMASQIGFGAINVLNDEQDVTFEFLRNLGGERGDSIRKLLIDSSKIHPEDRADIIQYWERATKGKVEDSLDKDIRVKIGNSYHWIKNLITQETFDPENKNIQLLGVNIDINKQKLVERELKTAKEKAESSDLLKSAFLANMSHEIRTPLNAIVGFSDLLAVTDDKSERTQFKEIIHQNNELLLQLINDILDFSKIEANTLEFHYSNVNVNTSLHNLIQAMQLKKRPDQNVEIKFEPENSECIIYTDKNRFTQVFSNFLTNAIKFTEKGSIIAGYHIRENDILFYVKDTGMGIEKEKSIQVFNRFVKLNSTKQGAGLGLSICKSIVNKLGGEIGVESERGKGSTFWFSLPKNLLNESKGEDEDTLLRLPNRLDALQKNNNRKTLLIAENSSICYNEFEAILSKRYTLLHAEQGEEAIALFLQKEPDGIIMNIEMPICDGLQAAEVIRKISQTTPMFATIPLGKDYSSKANRNTLLTVGFNETIKLPLKPSEIFNVLEAFNL